MQRKNVAISSEMKSLTLRSLESRKLGGVELA